MASSSKEKRSMALLSSSPFFLKAPLRGEGCAARCLLAECLWSSCRQAGRTSWSRTLQAGCGVHPLPGGRQQLAQGASCALLTCEVTVELVTPNRSNKLVEDSAGRLRPTAAARMNGNSLLSKLDKRCGQEAGCSGAPARRRPGGRHGRRSLGRSTALTHEASLARGVPRRRRA